MLAVILAEAAAPRCRLVARRRWGVGARGWGGGGERGLQGINATIGCNSSQAVLQAPVSAGPIRLYRMAVTPAAVNALLVLTAGDPHQTALIPQVLSVERCRCLRCSLRKNDWTNTLPGAFKQPQLRVRVFQFHLPVAPSSICKPELLGQGARGCGGFSEPSSHSILARHHADCLPSSRAGGGTAEMAL